MKLKYVLIAIVSLGLLGTLLLPAPAAVVAADNLAVNGDLEMGNANGWTVNHGSIDAAVYHGGRYSLKLTATNAYAEAAMKTIPVRKNATITVSFYYRYDAAPGSKLYHIYTYQGANTYSGTYSNADKSFSAPSGCNGLSDWKQISYTFNSGNFDAITELCKKAFCKFDKSVTFRFLLLYTARGYRGFFSAFGQVSVLLAQRFPSFSLF